MKQYGILLATVVLIAACVPAAAFNNGGFEDNFTGWSHSPEGVQISAEQAAAESKCVVLSASSGQQASITSDPAPVLADAPVKLSWQFRLVSGGGSLATALVSKSGHTILWVEDTPDDDRWHTIELLLQGGGDDRHSILFTASGEGQWALDSVSTTSAELPKVADHPRFAPDATYPEPLGEGWAPDGYLDARCRDLMGQKELVVNIGPLKITLPAEDSCERGIRHGVTTFCTNGSKWDRELTISVQGPPGTRVPDWTVPIAGDARMKFRVPVQCMQTGDHHVKVTFSLEDESASAPLRLHCSSRYPVFGATYNTGERPSESSLNALKAAGCWLHAIHADRRNLADLADPAAELLVTVPTGPDSTDPSEPLNALQSLQRDIFWIPEPKGLTGKEAVITLARAVRKEAGIAPEMMSYPVRVIYDADAAQLRPDDPEEFHALGAAIAELSLPGGGSINSAVLQMPDLPGPVIVGATRDGNDYGNAIFGSVERNRMLDLAPLRALANSSGLNLRFSITDLAIHPTGNRMLEALDVLKAAASGMYQGMTAWCLPLTTGPGAVGLLPASGVADGDPVLQAVRALAGELTGATPVVGPGEADGMSPRPDARVTYKVFLRRREGIVVMWNNTARPIEVAVEFRSQPVTCRLLRFAPGEPFMTEQFQPIFRLTEDARERNALAVYESLHPGEVVCITTMLADPHLGWLRGVKTKGEATHTRPVLPEYDRRPWWEQLGQGR
ncbi:MAG: hypothetical protein ACLFWB_11925 [Armatimonadota bacterium]